MPQIKNIRMLLAAALGGTALCIYGGWGDPSTLQLAQSLLSAGNIAITQVEKQIERKSRG
jgi:hypothetical protein